MLTRPSRRVAQSGICSPLVSSCRQCLCVCGRQLDTNGFVRQQKRGARASPKAKKPQGVRAKTPYERDLERDEHEFRIKASSTQAKFLNSIFSRLGGVGLLSAPAHMAFTFFADFAHAIVTPSGSIAPEMKVEQMKALMEPNAVSEDDAYTIALHVMWRNFDSIFNGYGKAMLRTLSNMGYARATIRILEQAVAQNKWNPVLHSPYLARPRQHLEKLAATGDDYRAMVLEGKVAYALKNERKAIEMWTQAMQAAVSAADDRRSAKQKQGQTSKAAMAQHEFPDLASPWNDLAEIHFKRKESYQAEWAIDIGCEQDDPISHYYKALLERVDNVGEHTATSRWLYHMTKAASSGYAVAAHELGVFYAQNGWKYIEDEPPDEVKPTPFDSHPADRSILGEDGIQRLWQVLGFTPKRKEDPVSALFHTAVFPSTPLKRRQLALAWLDVGMKMTYAPSYLFAARLLLEKRLWGETTAPKEALELDESRYTYASKADRVANRPIDRPIKAPPPDLKNPTYDPKLAQSHLRQVFYALAAHRFRLRHLQKTETGSRDALEKAGYDWDQFFHENMSGVKLTPQAQRFYRYTDVRDMYMHETRCYDDTTGENLYECAKRVCDKNNLNIYDDDGALMYRGGLLKRRSR